MKPKRFPTYENRKRSKSSFFHCIERSWQVKFCNNKFDESKRKTNIGGKFASVQIANLQMSLGLEFLEKNFIYRNRKRNKEMVLPIIECLTPKK
jgi:hypothetical protein